MPSGAACAAATCATVAQHSNTPRLLPTLRLCEHSSDSFVHFRYECGALPDHNTTCDVQGDNFANSTDSRHYGAVPYALLRGRVFLKVCCCRDGVF